MASYVRGLYSYIRPGNETSPKCINDELDDQNVPTTPTEEKKSGQEPGLLKKAVSGVASGIYTVGSSTVGAGVTGVKWVAGTAYSASAGVFGTVGAVGSGAASIVSKVTTSKSKEHSD